MKIYACFSIYNLLIALVKALISNEQVDLLVGSQTPNSGVLLPRIQKLDCVNKIYFFNSQDYKKITYKNKIDKFLHSKNREIEYVEQRLEINWKDYEDNIYLFNDFEILGFYFVDRRIRYHLIEDGLNFFTYFNKYYNVKPNTYSGWHVKVKNFLNILHRPFGANQYVIDIEVNSLENLVIDTSKVVVVPRQQLYDRLNDLQKKVLYQVFCQNPVKQNLDDEKKDMLLCTQPLYLDGQLSDLKTQIQVYKDIIAEYAQKGYRICIKPHPRDDSDYTEICEQYQCWLIDRFIPSEVLNFNPDISYDLALSVTTTAIEALNFVKERKYLGFDYLEKYKNVEKV